ncbi:ATP-binding cassette domain-containing protein [Microbacterium invictum]|uniref:Branched-chain amino acid transport system permease protein n=1 Tax=Microbacterium invictum TaxID=515415 RepID=A0AA40VNZ8_9MICO|nr:ATP-binding cassette domain-containing protein [Microbacterium invictum]MBB4141319.1 branched-chain amino acid transport system permease protein [Microbacterium invictum]
MLGIVIAFAVSLLLPNYYVFLGASAIVAAITLLGLGVVTGSAGMISLCQMSFATIGAWVVTGLNVMDAPGDPVVWMICGGIVAGLLGVLVGLPALRLRGVNLAVVTLGFASAVHLTLIQLQFPGATAGVRVLRPDYISTDREFFVFAAVTLTVCALAVYGLKATRIGAGWRVVAFSERGTASAGASVSTTKLGAFAVSAMLAGISGGLVTMQVGFASPATFAVLMSLALYVLAVVIGSHLIDMAIVGGIMWVAIPEILKQFDVPQDWAFVVFGVLGIQAISSRSNLGEGLRAVLRSRRPPHAATTDIIGAAAPCAMSAAPAVAADAPVVLSATGLTVRFGTVAALDGVDVTLHDGEIVGLIGPNGAGKSTLTDVLTGFLPRHEGDVTLDGASLRGASPTRRARLGLRRTFQQDRVPPGLTIEAYVRFVARRRIPRTEIDDVLDFFGCPGRTTALAHVDVGTRRLIEVAAQLAARPRVLILDEPAAGLSHEAHIALGERLVQVPARFGASIILIEHDLDLVRRVCPRIVVLDFGKVVADGGQDAVLSNPRVRAAYMGDKELL